MLQENVKMYAKRVDGVSVGNLDVVVGVGGVVEVHRRLLLLILMWLK